MNCCSRYFPRKAAKPATTAISIQAAKIMQVNTGLERRCLVTLGITRGVREEGRKMEGKIISFQYKLLLAHSYKYFVVLCFTHTQTYVGSVTHCSKANRNQ